MTSPSTLGADDLRAVMAGYRDALRLHQVDINRLNVYPVPDGDTGTNMAADRSKPWSASSRASD